LNNYRRALALGLLVLVLAVVVVPLANVSVVLKSARAQQGSGQVYSNFTVSWTGNLRWRSSSLPHALGFP